MTTSTATQRRIVLTFLDQLVSSASNFAIGVVVARLAGPAQFGDYMLTFMTWIVIVGLHRALITDPLIVTTGEKGDQGALAHGVSAELLLGAVVTAVVAAAGAATVAAGAPLGALMLALSPWLIPLLLQDYWRSMAFLRRRPGLALLNDLVFAFVQAVAVLVFLVLGLRTAGYIIAAWGIGATVGALLGSRWFPSARLAREGRDLLRRLWPLSRWMVADFGTGFAASQAYLAFAAVLLSRVDYGGFRAALSLMGPALVILHAGANMGLPEASRRAEAHDRTALRSFARRLSTTTAVGIALYGGAVAVAGERLLTTLYGPEFARFDVLVTLAAVQFSIAALLFGQEISVKAAGRMRLFWRARAAVSVASLATIAVLVRWLGTVGAGWAGVMTGGYYAAGVYAVYRVELAGQATGEPDGPRRPGLEPSTSLSTSAAGDGAI